MTRAELRNRIFNGLNESVTNPVFWTTSEMDDIIQEGMETLAEECSQIRRSYLMPLRAGVLYYSIHSVADDIMTPYRVWHQGLKRPLIPVSVSHLDKRQQNWPQDQRNPEVWFPFSWDIFGIWPSASAAGGVLQVDCIAWPRPLMDDDDEPEFRESDQDGLVLYGIYDGLLKQWDIEKATLLFVKLLEKIPMSKARGTAEKNALHSIRSSYSTESFRTGIP